MHEVQWIKIIINIFDDEKIKIIEDLPDGDTILVIWFKLLCLAGKTNDGGLIYITRDIHYNEEKLAKVMNRKIETVRLALKTFIEFKMIVIEDDIPAILNWEKHQSFDKLALMKEKNKERVRLYREKQKSLINKDKEIDKEIDIESNITVTLHSIIDYLNLKTNKEYRKNSDKTNTFIKSRLNEKFTLDDFKKVIDIKCSQWLNDPKMSAYLRPETLFGTKFESYLNEKATPMIEEKPAPKKYYYGDNKHESYV